MTATLTVERISILLDGEMDRSEAAAAIAAVCADPALRRHWHELHRAGDALRSEEVAALDTVDFCSRVATVIASRAYSVGAACRAWCIGDAPLLDARARGGRFGSRGCVRRGTVDASARDGFDRQEFTSRRRGGGCSEIAADDC